MKGFLSHPAWVVFVLSIVLWAGCDDRHWSTWKQAQQRSAPNVDKTASGQDPTSLQPVAKTKSEVQHDPPETLRMNTEKTTLTDAEWRQRLTPEQYRVLRRKGTERPYTGEYWNSMDAGLYRCVGCGSKLFISDAKFVSHCGWPSFFEPVRPDALTYRRDTSAGMVRTEVLCSQCGGHLGHVFEDGPPPTGLRFCINSVALQFGPLKTDHTREP